MYVYQNQYGWVLAPKTNSKISYVKYWHDFHERTYKSRAEAEARMAEIWKLEGY